MNGPGMVPSGLFHVKHALAKSFKITTGAAGFEPATSRLITAPESRRNTGYKEKTAEAAVITTPKRSRIGAGLAPEWSLT